MMLAGRHRQAVGSPGGSPTKSDLNSTRKRDTARGGAKSLASSERRRSTKTKLQDGEDPDSPIACGQSDGGSSSGSVADRAKATGNAFSGLGGDNEPVPAGCDLEAVPSNHAARTAAAAAEATAIEGSNVTALLEHFRRSLEQDHTDALELAEMETFWQRVFPDMRGKRVKEFTDGVFYDIDINGDGQVTFEELHAYLEGLRVGDDDASLGRQVYKSRPKSWSQWLWAVVEPGSTVYLDVYWLPTCGKVFAFFSQLAIAGSVIIIILESLPQMQNEGRAPGNDTTFAVEATCITFFTVEFFLRVLSCPSQREFWLSVFTWVDIVSILPFYLVLFKVLPNDSGAQTLVALRIVRILRLIRLFKLGRHFKGIQLLFTALVEAADALLASMLVFNIIGIVIWASLIQIAERHDASFDHTGELGYKGKWVRHANLTHLYNDAGKPIDFQTIPVAMWWAWVTLTTVGYGDMYPRTDWGRCVASFAMVSGLLVVAYPVTMLMGSLEFAQQEYRQRTERLSRQKMLVRKLHQRGNLDLEVPAADAADASLAQPPLKRLSSQISPALSVEAPSGAGDRERHQSIDGQSACSVLGLEANHGSMLACQLSGSPCSSLSPRSRPAPASTHSHGPGRRGSMVPRPSSRIGRDESRLLRHMASSLERLSLAVERIEERQRSFERQLVRLCDHSGMKAAADDDLDCTRAAAPSQRSTQLGATANTVLRSPVSPLNFGHTVASEHSRHGHSVSFKAKGGRRFSADSADSPAPDDETQPSPPAPTPLQTTQPLEPSQPF